MRKKLLIAALALFVGSATAHAALVPVYTSCGKVTYIDSEHYETAQEMVDDVKAIEEALCKGNKEKEEEKKEKIVKIVIVISFE